MGPPSLALPQGNGQERRAACPVVRAWLVLLLVPLAGCFGGDDDPAPPAPPPATPFTFGGEGCREFVVLLPLPAGNVRPLLPDRFRMVGEDAGQATVGATLLRCAETTVAGEAHGEAAQAEAGVLIESPDGSDATHFYELWLTSELADLTQRLDRFGVFGGPMAEPTVALPVEAPGGLLLGTAQASVPWQEGPYHLVLDVAGPPAPLPLGSSVWWHQGRDGFVAITYNLTEVRGHLGAGTVEAVGGPMGDMLGGAAADGPGFLASFGFTADVAYVRLP